MQADSQQIPEQDSEQSSEQSLEMEASGASMDQGDSLADAGDAAVADATNEQLDRIIESVLFAAGAPISFRKLVEILDGPSAKDVQSSLARIKATFGPGQRGIQLHEVAGGFQFRTARENAEWVRSLFKEKPTRLGRAALETLAVIAYRQPVTKADIELIRGVDVDGTLNTLLARKLIKIAGRKEAVGRPLLYATSTEFLEIFGLKDLNELPSLKELGPGPDAEYQEALALENEGETGAVSPTAAAGETEPGLDADDNAAAPAENLEPDGGDLAAQSGGDDSGGSGSSERARDPRAGDEGEPT